MAAETVELHKLKHAELKQECLARGLETKGNKQDLINRLQTYLEQHAEEEANEEDVLGEETEEEEPKPVDTPIKEEVPTEKSTEVPNPKTITAVGTLIPPKQLLHMGASSNASGKPPHAPEGTAVIIEWGAEKKVVKITSEIPQMERMQKRAERFNVPVSLESKKAARAARFGMPVASTKGLAAENKTTVNIDKLKERAQRFGLNVSTVSKKTEDDEKLKKRKERFGIVTSSAGTGTTEDTEAKKRKRAERFGIV